jgi:quercetin dioxygenase-like cupin family protein
MTIPRSAAAVLVALGCAAGAARADEAGPDDAKVGRALQEELRAHGGDVHGCWGVALAAEPKLSGELLVRLQIQPDGAVSRAEVLKDQVGSGRLTGCLIDAMRRWKTPRLAGSAPQQVVFPLAFKPDDAPAVPRYVVPSAGAKPGPLPGGKLEARVLVANATVGPTKASLTLLTLKPSARLALHAHPHALELIYVLKGRAHIRWPDDGPRTLEAGTVWPFAPGVGHSIEAAPLAPLELLQIFVPAGPELAYLDPSKRDGTRPVKEAKRTGAMDGQVEGDLRSKVLPILGGKGSARILLDGVYKEASIQQLEAEPGAVVPVHQHDGADELIYVVAGRGEMTVAGRVYPVAAGDAVHIPANTPHGLKVTEKLSAVQCYAPAGPEQRFKPPAAASHPRRARPQPRSIYSARLRRAGAASNRSEVK